MDKSKIEAAVIAVLKEKGNKKFTQTVDLIINLKEIDLKKNDQQLDFFINLPKKKGRVSKICGLVGPELLDEAKANLDHVIEVHNFDVLKGKSSEIKNLAETYDFFIAQANIMPQIATSFGRILGSRGKMPNPKAGCIVPPKAQLGPIVARLRNTVRIVAKTSTSIKVPVGTEAFDVATLVENINAVYTNVVSHTVQGENNIKNVIVKLTMGKPVKVD